MQNFQTEFNTLLASKTSTLQSQGEIIINKHLETMNLESDGMIAKLLNAYKDDTSIAEVRDGTITTILKTKALAINDLHKGVTKINTATTTAMNRINDIKTNTLLYISN